MPSRFTSSGWQSWARMRNFFSLLGSNPCAMLILLTLEKSLQHGHSGKVFGWDITNDIQPPPHGGLYIISITFHKGVGSLRQ